MKPTLSNLIVFSFSIVSVFMGNGTFAQEKAPVVFGKIKASDFEINSSLVDPATTAVIIADIGETKFEGNAKGWFTYVFKRQRRIKIINKEAFDMANIGVLLYQNENDREKAEKISACAYNMENGKVTETKLSQKDIYEVLLDKNYVEKKFTVPGVKEGSIIEYSYIVRSNFEFNLPSWAFQHDKYPTLWSEYTVEIPSLLSYMSYRQGYHTYYIDKTSDVVRSYSITRRRDLMGNYGALSEDQLSVTSPSVIRRWVMKDIPPFEYEKFTTSPENFIDKISFQLYRTYDGASYHDVAVSWKDVAGKMLKREDFGLLLYQNNTWAVKILQGVISPSDNDWEKTNKIFRYVRDNYTCTDRNNKYITTTLKDVAGKKSGSVGDINLLMVALLSQAGFVAEPVLLSTREFGRNLPTYPMLNKLNYVICRLSVGNKFYFLDAATPYMDFGEIPLECYNGHARVINSQADSVYLNPDSITEKSSYDISLINTNGGITGKLKYQPGYYGSVDLKSNIASKAGSSLLSLIQKSISADGMSLENVSMKDSGNAEAGVIVNADLQLGYSGDAARVYFDPVLANDLKINPFIASERKYPIELPCLKDVTYQFSMMVPEGFTVEEMPKSVRLELKNGEGIFEYNITNTRNKIVLKAHQAILRTYFEQKDYQSFRDFYAGIVKKCSEPVVFKRIQK